MPDINTILIRRWKTMLLFSIIAVAIASVAVALKKKEYLATLTALPSSIVNTDKARIFNNNIQSLYSDLGSADDLDRIVGTADLDTIYIAAANELNLKQHYGVTSTTYAANKLKDNSKIAKTEYGQLKIKVWDHDARMSVQLASNLFQKLNAIHQNLQGQSNALVLEKIQDDYMQLQQQFQKTADSINTAPGTLRDLLAVRKQAQLAQLEQYEKLLSEYRLMVKANPPVMMIVEAPQLPTQPDRPKMLATLLVVFVAAFLFSFLLSLFLETRI